MAKRLQSRAVALGAGWHALGALRVGAGPDSDQGAHLYPGRAYRDVAIYAGFYAFDETGHAFGPDDSSSLHTLRHVDRTIKKVAVARGERYELVVL